MHPLRPTKSDIARLRWRLTANAPAEAICLIGFARRRVSQRANPHERPSSKWPTTEPRRLGRWA
jgi:hypothetical protein